ncbi:MAG TPA: Flp family type IVb pilin [Xanthobacteraceae bacterium]|nr:Flp family type IVb pilin [Xanthobacteraceae bacterium]
MKRRLQDAKVVREFLRDAGGATAIEYAVLASMISIAVAGVALGVGSALVENYYGKVLEGFQK